jgi:hypothetical protein
MKILTRVLALCFLVGALVGVNIAQESEPDPSHAGTVIGSHDRFEEKSLIDLRSMIVAHPPGLQLLLNVHGEYSGSPKPPAQVNLVFFAITLFDYKYSGQCKLNVIADGEHLNFELPVIQNGEIAGLKVQSIGRRIDYSDLRKIARASKVDMRFQGTEFSLSDAQRTTFHDFLKHFWDDK